MKCKLTSLTLKPFVIEPLMVSCIIWDSSIADDRNQMQSKSSKKKKKKRELLAQVSESPGFRHSYIQEHTWYFRGISRNVISSHLQALFPARASFSGTIHRMMAKMNTLVTSGLLFGSLASSTESDCNLPSEFQRASEDASY